MIKLQHTIVSINGLRYVQLKSCLLKWPPHQKLASSRKLKQISGISPFLRAPPLHESIFPLHSTMFYAVALVNTSSKDNEISLDMWQEKTPKRGKSLLF